MVNPIEANQFQTLKPDTPLIHEIVSETRRPTANTIEHDKNILLWPSANFIIGYSIAISIIDLALAPKEVSISNKSTTNAFLGYSITKGLTKYSTVRTTMLTTIE